MAISANQPGATSDFTGGDVYSDPGQMKAYMAWGQVGMGFSMDEASVAGSVTKATSSQEKYRPPTAIVAHSMSAPSKTVFETKSGHDKEDFAVAIAIPTLQTPPDKKILQKDKPYDFMIFMSLLLIGTFVTLLILQAVNNGKEGSVPSFNPTSSVEDTYLKQLSTVGEDSVYEFGTYYKRAADWIMNLDPLQMDPYDPGLLQQYILVLLYMITTDNGARLWKSCNPLKSSGKDGGDESDCMFDKLYRTAEDSLAYQQLESKRWLSGESSCSWAGVLCNSDDTVTGLDLCKWAFEKVVYLSLPCVSLTFLAVFALPAGQNITGTLPTELASLCYILTLSLPYNNLVGSIPEEVTALQYIQNINLQGNKFTGTVPDDLWKCGSLEQLSLGENQLSGTIPSIVGLLTSLQDLHLGFNAFKGSIPETLGQLYYLSHLKMNHNQFPGTIPTLLGHLSRLEGLWMQQNRLMGPIPSQVGSLSSLLDLQLYKNHLTGTFPDQVYDISGLQRIELSDNEFSGTLSTKIGLLQDLQDF
jgi:hypothetical protein